VVTSIIPYINLVYITMDYKSFTTHTGQVEKTNLTNKQIVLTP
jgi:hypothetical protein